MATRATIIIEGFELCKVYKHCDGYPSATLPWLSKFNADFTKNRGNDPEYKIAQLLRASAFDQEAFRLDPSRATGWGLVSVSSGCNADYEYVLHKDGTTTHRELL